MNYSYWDDQRGKVKSKKGGWRVGKKVECHGLDLMEEVVGKLSYMQIVILNATGKLVSKELAEWFEAIHICLSWPDPRIWCNRIGALGGASGASTVASTCSGVMAADSISYGIRPIIQGMKFILKAGEFDADIEAFVINEIKNKGGKPHLMGYARPVANGDERISVLERLSKKLGFTQGRYLDIAFQIDSILNREFSESMNLNGYVSAFLSDQGFTPEESYRVFAVVLSSGVASCSVDYSDRTRGSFAPLRVEDVVYTGHTQRAVSV